MDAVGAAILVVAVIWTLVLVRRVKGEYEREGVLSDATVGAVWLSYGLLLGGIIAAAVVGAWPLGISSTASLLVGIPLLVIGLAIQLAGLVSMGSLARMNGQDPDRLITEGAFRYSRNPQNVGVGIAGVGVALLGDSGLALALVLATIVLFRIYLVYEEQHLERVFGDEFRSYKERTPRFVGVVRDTSRSSRSQARTRGA